MKENDKEYGVASEWEDGTKWSYYDETLIMSLFAINLSKISESIKTHNIGLNKRRLSMAKMKLYGVSSKYMFGYWNHQVYTFEDDDEAEKWLHSEEQNFRERELMSKTKAIKLAGRKAVENASLWYSDKGNYIGW